jgi:hypothetical protein
MNRPAIIIPDHDWPGLYRVRWPDGTFSDQTNLTRAKDAVASYDETSARRTRHRAAGGQPWPGRGLGARQRPTARPPSGHAKAAAAPRRRSAQ